MTPADKGRFCASCQKTVFDFTKSSDREIASILKNTNNACGRFRATQLDRDLVVPKEKSTIWMAASAAVVSFLTIGNHAVSAQTPVNTEQHTSETDEITGNVAHPKKWIINGIVTDSSDMPIPGANIFIKGTQQGVQTDFDGKFSIEVQKNDTLEISYVDRVSQNIIIKDDSKIIVKLVEDNSIEGLIVENYRRTTGQTFTIGATTIEARSDTQKSTFFGRMFHSIGNWFR